MLLSERTMLWKEGVQTAVASSMKATAAAAFEDHVTETLDLSRITQCFHATCDDPLLQEIHRAE